ncbi:hypothetical protein ACFO0N_15265 [Halobium salinum]|uniref:Uncharacterized protein n=1 Tax=Halobium salinum TaxID=1364940 RepID=A0ABD5PEM4_9EURY|nr:hypothetical protein [Halobium salinum]
MMELPEDTPECWPENVETKHGPFRFVRLYRALSQMNHGAVGCGSVRRRNSV